MTDRRFLASNGQVADATLKGRVQANQFVTPTPGVIATHATWLHSEPDGDVDRQLLWGDAVAIIETRGNWTFIRAEKDGYVGWVETVGIGPATEPTHRVSVRTTWAYHVPNFKVSPTLPLHFGSRLVVETLGEDWSKIAVPHGHFYLPTRQLSPINAPLDLVESARLFLGTPYVWAGNSGFGIDCSGLVQAAFHAANRTCPPDSDLQEKMAGTHIDDAQDLTPGDLIFWKRHVALVSGPGQLIHANAHHMTTIEEPVQSAIARIAQSDTGPATSMLRPT